MKRLIVVSVVVGLLAVGIAVPAFASNPPVPPDDACGTCPPNSKGFIIGLHKGMNWKLDSAEVGSSVDRNGDGYVCYGYVIGPHNKKPVLRAVIDNNLPLPLP